MKNKNANKSVASSLGLVFLSTTCCALPLLLVTLGMGGAVASMVSVFPWLVPLSKYKAMTFAITALMLGYAWWQVLRIINREGAACAIEDAKRLRLQKRILIVATIFLGVSVFVAYGLLPLVQLFE